MDDQLHEDIEETSNFRIDLISSLFGQQIAQGILLKDDQNPTNITPNPTCIHPIFISNICTNCGKVNNSGEIATLPFWYIYPNLTLSVQECNRIRGENLVRALTRKRLHLVLDLDHTLLHQRPNYKLSPEDRKFLSAKKHGIDYNVADGGSLFRSLSGWVKLRPFVRDFLEEASEMFDMTIYTLGGRDGSWMVAKMLDPTGKYFDNWRVITREDYCGALDKHKKWLDLVLEHEKVVVVLDDNEAVWDGYKANVLKVVPYNFFSYFSPEDKEHDASPPRESWSQLGGDEREDDGVLATVLGKLREIYSGFYEDGVVDYEGRDVREVIQRVLMSEKPCKKKHQKTKKTGRTVRS